MTVGRFALVVVVLAALNWGLLAGRRARNEERLELAARVSERVRERVSTRGADEKRSRLADLVLRVEVPEASSGGIGPLREALVSAETSAAVERLSLELRPDDTAPDSIPGARVQASLQGPFHAVFRYLDAVESLRLALSPESLVLRRVGENGDVAASVRWIARWPKDLASPPPEPAAGAVAQLSRWLSRQSSSPSRRDPFGEDRGESTPSDRPLPGPPPSSLPEPVPEPAAPRTPPDRPVLSGFVLAPPELEPDVDRRVLAALSYEGKVYLTQVGDPVGAGFTVERIVARESVTLIRSADGVRLVLTLP